MPFIYEFANVLPKMFLFGWRTTFEALIALEYMLPREEQYHIFMVSIEYNWKIRVLLLFFDKES